MTDQKVEKLGQYDEPESNDSPLCQDNPTLSSLAESRDLLLDGAKQ